MALLNVIVAHEVQGTMESKDDLARAYECPTHSITHPQTDLENLLFLP